MNTINYSKCMALKNRESFLQCPYNKKKGDFCGIHCRSKNIIRIDECLKISDNNLSNQSIKIIDSSDVDDNLFETCQTIEQFKTIISDLISPETLKISFLRNNIKKYNLNIKTKQSKRELFIALKAYYETEDYYLAHLDKVIYIQSLYRRFSVIRRVKCTNFTDVLTLDSKYSIPVEYYFDIEDKLTNKFYCFDIRSLCEIIAQDKIPKNPYTSVEFSKEDLEIIETHIENLKNFGTILEIEKPKLNPVEIMDLYMVEVFQRFDSLDNYTDHRWFKYLSLMELKTLWKKAEDVWNYRSQLPFEAKKEVVKDGVAFTIPFYVIDKQNDILKLQKILLDEFNRFLVEGSSRDEKKLGAMLMLTALVEVSGPAADAMPHYVQVA